MPVLMIALSLSVSSDAKPAVSKSWFREKYLSGVYDVYHDYTLKRYQFGDNDIDMCPDVYKSSSIFAITGQHINDIKTACATLYIPKTTSNNAHYTPPKSHYMHLIHITVMDVFRFLWQLSCYIFEIGMLVMSLVLLSCSTLFMIILMFCQY